MALQDIQVSGNKDIRSGFGDGILEAARKNENVVALTADLAGSLKLGAFIKEFPERYIQVGIAETNMIWHCSWLNHWRKDSLYNNICQFQHGSCV